MGKLIRAVLRGRGGGNTTLLPDYLAVTARQDIGASFYYGKAIRAKADHYARLRKRLQHKGTPSATRRLVIISGRERRLKQATNHRVSRRIVDQHPHSLIGLEDLTHIRERTKRLTGKRATRKQRWANHHASEWAFAELHGYIAYKALLSGVRVAVEPSYKPLAFAMGSLTHYTLPCQEYQSRQSGSR